MNKWFKVGIVGVALSLVTLGALAFAVLRPMPVSAQGGINSGPGMGRGGRMGGPGGGLGQGSPFTHPGGPGGAWGSIDREALLAEALGITVEELQAARQQADVAAVLQAVDEGLITQNEADSTLARIQLRSYLDRDALLAEALELTPEALQAARDEGKPLAVIIYEQGLDPATLRTKMETAHEEAVQQAVTDGVITQEQADEILAGPGAGFGPQGFDGFHGRGGFGGRGGPAGPPGFGGGFGWQ
jgi:lambda repressor-like predicted transcriptional regulator